MAKTDNIQEPAVDTTEQRIFEAAREVFTQKGMDGAKMQEIADRAGINKALLHYYYRSKEKLYEMVARAIVGKMLPTIRQLLESEQAFEDKIRGFIDFYIDIIGRNPFIPLFVITEINKHPERFFETILPKDLPRPEVFFSQVEAEVAAGRIRPIAPQHLLVNMISMCIFPFVAKPMIRILLGMSPGEIRLFLEERKREVTAFMLAGLRP
ncbi:MAG: TetR/AcrR family transcriptional regulator [Lewinellaceae bacterium]|nr:TetR/AcrR family transcriptional regulator [Saprospiraceae bacterium]MCB0541995.1 TetR/AcrR family transcriptional regulator [Saprospiraceae bacterium]MCB9305198.1 TetR/AcrR family transcriptional regulator [Lewinellaceae bacterium]MCB9354343.1 TetR/AcrR family transcriptional regulator [Lewinellaceae bacterium]